MIESKSMQDFNDRLAHDIAAGKFVADDRFGSMKRIVYLRYLVSLKARSEGNAEKLEKATRIGYFTFFLFAIHQSSQLNNKT